MKNVKPQRLQRKRTAGFKMANVCKNPNGFVYVGRPTKWGNNLHDVPPFTRYRACIKALIKRDSSYDLEELRGKDLVCWCTLTDPCHVDVLLKIANE